jgi:hypothetical protein
LGIKAFTSYLALNGHDISYRSWLGREGRPGPARKQAELGLGSLVYRIERHMGFAPARGGDHFGNFLDAVRTRRSGDLHAEIEEGAISSMLVHLANISYRLGHTVEFDPISMTCKDHQAQALFTKPYREPYLIPKVG